jgi:hypothetical protein
MRRRVSGLLAAGLLVAACGSGAIATPIPAGSPSAATQNLGAATGATATPSPTSSPAAGVSSSPAPAVPTQIPTTAPSRIATGATPFLRWVEVGTIMGMPSGMPSIPVDLVGFTKGYVAGADSDHPMAYFSRDGVAWRAIRLPEPADFRSAQTQPGGLASNGTRVVIVGGYGHEPCIENVPGHGATGGGPDCVRSPVSWVSDDGVTWRTSLPWVGPVGTAAGFSQGSEFSSVWAVPGGWEAALFYWSGEGNYQREIWSSRDGLSWARAANVSDVGADNSGQRTAIVDATGRRLMWSNIAVCRPSSDCRGESRLWTSTDGVTWRAIPARVGMSYVQSGLAPGQANSPWMLAGGTCDPSGNDCHAAAWLSRDLRTWSSASLPGAGYLTTIAREIARTPGGYVLVAWWTVGAYGQATWVSGDGIGWTALPNPPLVWTASGGPAGTVGIGGVEIAATGPRPVYVLR